MVGRNPPWSDLPQELLSAIVNSLTSNPLCILIFRSVCNSWRSSCPPLSHPSILSPLLPLSIPRPPFSIRRLGSSECSFLSVTAIYALRRPLDLSEGGFSSLAPNTWILFLDEYNAGKVSVRKPFSNGSYSVPINFPKNINLFDFDVHELGRFHNLSYSYSTKCHNKPRFHSEDVDKVILFPNGLAAIALFDDGKLGMIRLDVGINEVGQCGISEWKVIHDGKGFRFDDIVEYKGRVLGIDRRGRVYEIGYHSSQINPVAPSIAGGGGRRKRLVESLGLLYLVVRCNAKTDKRTRMKVHKLNEERRKPKFKVYELNEGRKKWVEITSLGDRSFLFGHDFSFSASAEELGTCEKNCILFQKQCFQSYSGEDDDSMVFCKLESTDLYIRVCHLTDAVHFGAIESYPGYSDTLWPPPPWIRPLDRLKRLGIVDTLLEEILNKIPENFKIKATEQTVDGTEDSSVLKAVREVIDLKKLAIRFQESIKNLNQVIENVGEKKLNQFDGLLADARPSTSHGSEERLGCPDDLRTVPEELVIGHAAPACATIPVLRERDAFLFQLEELATKMEWSQKARLAAILTG